LHKNNCSIIIAATHPFFPALEGGDTDKSVFFHAKRVKKNAEKTFSSPRRGFADERGLGSEFFGAAR
jgi:hypothetical protein